jgi:hypothetical protein
MPQASSATADTAVSISLRLAINSMAAEYEEKARTTDVTH